MSAGEQMQAVTRYLRDRGLRASMGIHQIYNAINAGVSDWHLRQKDSAAGGAPGTVREKVDYQMGPHRRKGVALLRADGLSEMADGDMAPGSGSRAGDAMMRRFYGDEAPSAKMAQPGKGTLRLEFINPPAGMRPRASMDDLFKEVEISKSRQMEATNL